VGEHPAEYPWSSYRYNALGEADSWVVPHGLYMSLADNSAERLSAYRALFDVDVENKTVDEIREATNKSWVLGSDYFKTMIKDKIDRPMNPREKGGDRRSNKYKAGCC